MYIVQEERLSLYIAEQQTDTWLQVSLTLFYVQKQYYSIQSQYMGSPTPQKIRNKFSWMSAMYLVLCPHSVFIFSQLDIFCHFFGVCRDDRQCIQSFFFWPSCGKTLENFDPVHCQHENLVQRSLSQTTFPLVSPNIIKKSQKRKAHCSAL